MAEDSEPGPSESETDSPVDGFLFDETVRSVDRELDSRRSLNTNLQQLMAFAGALLAVTLALSPRIGSTEIGCVASVVMAICFVGSIALLVAALVVAIRGVGPEPRSMPNPEVLLYYAKQRSPQEEIRRDLFKAEVKLLKQLEKGNTDRAEAHRKALRVLIVALGLAAGCAVTLFTALL